TVGGTGKTPVVEKFARELRDQGRNVAILSRGYRSKPAPVHKWLLNKIFFRDDTTPPRIVSDGKSLLLDSEMAGDEPYMLASNLARANTIFITKSDGNTAELRKQIAQFNPDAGIIECIHHPLYLEDVFTGQRLELDFLKARKVASLSGIAQPESFEQNLVSI